MRAAALAFLLLAAAAPADKAEQDALKADSRAAALRRDQRSRIEVTGAFPSGYKDGFGGHERAGGAGALLPWYRI